MPSVVHAQRKSLTALGEYVVLANIASGWFAVFENTLRARTEDARRHGRDGPNLIVYRTRDSETEPRDHYVVPYAKFRDLVTDSTVADAKIKSSRRWNLTLRNGLLHVTHGTGAIDVSPYHRAPLLIEATSEASPVTSISMPAVYQSVEALEGLAKEQTSIARTRSTSLREAALKASGGVCEACGVDFVSLLGGLGARALQVHHKNQLAHQAEEVVTTMQDLAVVCANCHSLVHAERDRPMPVEELQALWRRYRSCT